LREVSDACGALPLIHLHFSHASGAQVLSSALGKANKTNAAIPLQLAFSSSDCGSSEILPLLILNRANCAFPVGARSRVNS
jgi:hypothetical protein